MKYSKLTKSDLLKEINSKLEKLQKKHLVDFLQSLSDTTEISGIELIEDTGIKEIYSNGGRWQNIIFKCKCKCLYWKLSILSESYSSQSYIRLYSGDLNNWTLIKSGNPKKDYGIDIAYRDDYHKDVFKPIIDDYKKLIKRF